MDIDKLLTELVAMGASDLHLKVGRPPLIRNLGQLRPSPYPPATRPDVQAVLKRILNPRRLAEFDETLEVDDAYQLEGVGRFRVNAYIQKGEPGVAIRHIPLRVPTIDEWDLPEVLKDLALHHQGMILVTGPTGSGKSTTIAAMIQHVNTTRPCHIVTVEDPIEFVYTDEVATVNQRQVGLDTLALEQALRHVLRQDPDVILMGEMRDLETMEFALNAAETGHLVLSTLHTNDAKQCVDRILDMFPADKAKQMRSMLALNLLGIISQRLMLRADGNGRVAAVEILINSPHISELIAEGKTLSLDREMRSTGEYYKMQTFDQALADLVRSGRVTAEEALAHSTNPADLRLMLRGVETGGAAARRVRRNREEVDLAAGAGPGLAPAAPR
jgi:twitching motility protein PilT